MGNTSALPATIRQDPPSPTPTPSAPRKASESPVAHPWRGKLLWGCLVLVAFAVGWALASKSSNRREKEALPTEAGLTPTDQAAVVVTVEPVKYRPVQRTIEGVGTLHGFEEISISARVEGHVRKLRFDVADRFKPGEVLLEVDPTDYDLSIQQAQSALQVELAKLGLQEPPGPGVDLNKVPSVTLAQTRMDNLQTRLERVRRLVLQGGSTREELDNTTSDYRIAQAEYANQLLLAKAGLATIQMKLTALAVAQQQLKDTRVRVPTPTLPVPDATGGVEYTVTHRMVAEGTLVRPGMEVGKLVINQTLKLRVPIPERYSSEIKLGQRAEVNTAAFSRPFTGTVTRINPAVEPTTRTFEVEIQVSNPKGELKPGSYAKAAILTRMDKEAPTVPLAALVNFAGINKVFVAEKGKAKEVQVTLGVQTAEWVEIASPALPRTAEVVTSGQSILADDSPLTVRATSSK